MLQINIVHEVNSVKVCEIKDTSTLTILSQFDEETKKIDLQPLKSHVGEKAMISHYNIIDGNTNFDYEHIVTITDVEKDKDGIWYFQYN